MSDKIWRKVLDHAKTCTMDDCTVSRYPNGWHGVINLFNSISKVVIFLCLVNYDFVFCIEGKNETNGGKRNHDLCHLKVILPSSNRNFWSET